MRDHIEPVRVSTREEAEQLVRDGDVLGALIIPEDTFRKIESRVEQPRLEVIVSEEDPVKARLVDDAIAAALSEANRQVARALTRANLRYLDLLLNGGDVTVFGERFNVLGLRRIGDSVEAARQRLPRGSAERRDLDRVVRFTRIAQANFGLSSRVLTALSEPIRVDKQVVDGARVPLTTFAAAVAVAVSLMFVTVLLASGALALERDQNTFGRLVRGPVSRTALLVEKGLFAVAGALPVTLLMLLAVAVFATVEWDRFHLWVAAIAVAAAAFAAMGTLIGALAREVAAGLAAGLHPAAAGRVPGARALGGGEPGGPRRHAGRVVRIPVRRDRGRDALGPLLQREPGRPAAAPGGPGGGLRSRIPGCDTALRLIVSHGRATSLDILSRHVFSRHAAEEAPPHECVARPGT